MLVWNGLVVSTEPNSTNSVGSGAWRADCSELAAETVPHGRDSVEPARCEVCKWTQRCEQPRFPIGTTRLYRNCRRVLAESGTTVSESAVLLGGLARRPRIGRKYSMGRSRFSEGFASS